MKKRLAWVLVVAMVMSFVCAVPASAAEGEYVVHAKADWTAPALWAWSSTEGTNVFAAWPGQVLTADPDNAGWYYYSVPDTTDFVIINDNGAGAQTADLQVEAKELWLTVTTAGDDGKFLADVVYEAPADFVVAGAEEVVAETTDAPAADVPKTGVASFAFVYAGLAGIAGLGAMASKKRNTK